MARVRLASLGNTQPAVAPQLDRLQPMTPPILVESFPSESPHLARARLLANAGLNEYIAQEIKADPNSSSWSALAEAQIYASYGETYRAMRAIKRALPYAASAPVKCDPAGLLANSVSRALLGHDQSRVGEEQPGSLHGGIADSAGVGVRSCSGFLRERLGADAVAAPGRQGDGAGRGNENFQTFQLLDPETNIRLGTRYLRQMLDHFGGVQEYALAAYNAGDNRVADWEAAGPYQGMDEFVESIPFTQTREYVEAILRNEETYRAIDEYARVPSSGRASGGR